MTASVEHGLNNSASIPPLESGDRLTRHEFECRYTAMPHKKADYRRYDESFSSAATRFKFKRTHGFC